MAINLISLFFSTATSKDITWGEVIYSFAFFGLFLGYTAGVIGVPITLGVILMILLLMVITLFIKRLFLISDGLIGQQLIAMILIIIFSFFIMFWTEPFFWMFLMPKHTEYCIEVYRNSMKEVDHPIIKTTRVYWVGVNKKTKQKCELFIPHGIF